MKFLLIRTETHYNQWWNKYITSMSNKEKLHMYTTSLATTDSSGVGVSTYLNMVWEEKKNRISGCQFMSKVDERQIGLHNWQRRIHQKHTSEAERPLMTIGEEGYIRSRKRERKECKNAGTLKKGQKLNTNAKSTHVDNSEWDAYGRRWLALNNWKLRRQLGFGKSRRCGWECKKLNNFGDKHGASNTVTASAAFYPAGRSGEGWELRIFTRMAGSKGEAETAAKLIGKEGWKF